jgi:hypothetical protein
MKDSRASARLTSDKIRDHPQRFHRCGTGRVLRDEGLGLSFGLPKHDLPARLRIGSRKPVRHVGRHVCIIGTLDQQHRRRLSEAPASAMMRCGLASAIASSVRKNA